MVGIPTSFAQEDHSRGLGNELVHDCPFLPS
jgi:hypothetical protein